MEEVVVSLSGLNREALSLIEDEEVVVWVRCWCTGWICGVRGLCDGDAKRSSCEVGARLYFVSCALMSTYYVDLGCM